MSQKYMSAFLALLFVLSIFTYTVEAVDDEEEENRLKYSNNMPL